MLYNQTDVKQLQVGFHYLPFHLLHVLWHNFYFTNANNNCFQEINPSKPIDKETIMQTARRALHLMFNSWIHFIFSFPLFLSCLPFFFFWLFHTFPAQLPTSLLSSPTTFYWFEVQFLFDIVFELHFLSALTTQHLAPTVSTTKSFPYLLIRLSPFPIFYFIPFSLLLHTHLTQKLKQKFVQITENIYSFTHHHPECRDSCNTLPPPVTRHNLFSITHHVHILMQSCVIAWASPMFMMTTTHHHPSTPISLQFELQHNHNFCQFVLHSSLAQYCAWIDGILFYFPRETWEYDEDNLSTLHVKNFHPFAFRSTLQDCDNPSAYQLLLSRITSC